VAYSTIQKTLGVSSLPASNSMKEPSYGLHQDMQPMGLRQQTTVSSTHPAQSTAINSNRQLSSPQLAKNPREQKYRKLPQKLHRPVQKCYRYHRTLLQD
jgi:hypothetical protein